MVAGVIRWKLYLEWLLSHYIRKRVKRKVKILLKLTLYQVEFMRKPAYHVINEAVSFANSRWGKMVGGFVNAVLRNYTRTGKNLLPPDLSVKYSFPHWLTERWYRRFGEEIEELLSYLNTSPVFGLRVNTKKMSVNDVVNYLRKKRIDVESGKWLESALYTRKVGPILKDRLFKEGIIYVQDEASQLAVEALKGNGRGLLLDACSGYGTKTVNIVDRFGEVFRVVAMDLSIEKVRNVPPFVKRVVGDILFSPLKKEIFDAILLDAPCSSLGIIRKHPEVKWRISEDHIKKFSKIQLSLLEALWESLKPNGTLIYSVCSFEPEETFQVIEEFKEKAKFKVEKVFPFTDDVFFVSVPHRTGMDGFFIARLKKL